MRKKMKIKGIFVTMIAIAFFLASMSFPSLSHSQVLPASFKVFFDKQTIDSSKFIADNYSATISIKTGGLVNKEESYVVDGKTYVYDAQKLQIDEINITQTRDFYLNQKNLWTVLGPNELNNAEKYLVFYDNSNGSFTLTATSSDARVKEYRLQDGQPLIAILQDNSVDSTQVKWIVKLNLSNPILIGGGPDTKRNVEIEYKLIDQLVDLVDRFYLPGGKYFINLKYLNGEVAYPVQIVSRPSEILKINTPAGGIRDTLISQTAEFSGEGGKNLPKQKARIKDLDYLQYVYPNRYRYVMNKTVPGFSSQMAYHLSDYILGKPNGSGAWHQAYHESAIQVDTAWKRIYPYPTQDQNNGSYFQNFNFYIDSSHYFMVIFSPPKNEGDAYSLRGRGENKYSETNQGAGLILSNSDSKILNTGLKFIRFQNWLITAPSSDTVKLYIGIPNEGGYEYINAVWGFRPDSITVSVRDELKNEVVKIELFPNPASEYITLKNNFPVMQETQFFIMDVLGRKAEEGIFPAGESELKIEVEGLDAGLYVIRMGKISRFFIVE